MQREKYCGSQERTLLLNSVANTKTNWKCVHFYKDPAEQEHLEEVLRWIKSLRYAWSYNAHMGDKNITFRAFPWYEGSWKQNEKEQMYWLSEADSRRRVLGNSDDWEGI